MENIDFSNADICSEFMFCEDSNNWGFFNTIALCGNLLWNLWHFTDDHERNISKRITATNSDRDK